MAFFEIKPSSKFSTVSVTGAKAFNFRAGFVRNAFFIDCRHIDTILSACMKIGGLKG
jgi:hypothetical protein